jgi:hypothetical protein
MKTKLVKKMAILLLSVVIFSATAVSADALAANYVITPVAQQDLESGVEQAWKLSYDESRAPVVVELYSSKKGKTFVVRTDHFEVAYVSSPKGFGARKVKITESKVPDSLTSQVVDAEELAKQRILSTEEVDEKTAVELIAAYLPDLVNSSYKHLFNL